MNSATLVGLFTVPILVTKLNYSDIESVEAICKEEYNKDPEGSMKSNYGGWQSNNLQNCELEVTLFPEIQNICQQFAKDVLKIGKPVKMLNAWININDKNSSNVTHTHPHSILSGVYYVKTPENSGNIKFFHPAIDMFERDWSDIQKLEPLEINSPAWWFTPEEGHMYLFPSWLKHNVLPNKSDDERISISFNVA
jgi:uncharacterized protein (TIGR02466 family)